MLDEYFTDIVLDLESLNFIGYSPFGLIVDPQGVFRFECEKGGTVEISKTHFIENILGLESMAKKIQNHVEYKTNPNFDLTDFRDINSKLKKMQKILKTIEKSKANPKVYSLKKPLKTPHIQIGNLIYYIKKYYTERAIESVFGMSFFVGHEYYFRYNNKYVYGAQSDGAEKTIDILGIFRWGPENEIIIEPLKKRIKKDISLICHQILNIPKIYFHDPNTKQNNTTF